MFKTNYFAVQSSVILFILFSAFLNDAGAKSIILKNSSKPTIGIDANVQYGFILIHRSTIQHFSQTHFPLFQLAIYKRVTGTKSWHNLYYKPCVGFNLLYTNFSGNTLLKSAFGGQAFIDFCKRSYNKNSFHFRLAGGLGYVQQPFNRENNFKNIAIGSHLNGLIQLGYYFDKNISRKIGASVGASITHLSNGAIKVPNLGLNILTAGIIFHCSNKNFDDIKTIKLIDTIPQKKHFEITIGAGIKQNYPVSSISYVAVSTRFQYYFYIKQKYNVSAGTDLFYDNGIRAKLKLDNAYNDANKTAVQVGVNMQYQQNIGRFSIPLFFGAYAFSNYKDNGLFYSGLGIKHKITEHISAAIILKTHFARADYFMWSICYQ